MRRGNAIIAIIVGVLALVFFMFAIIYYAVFGQTAQLLKGLGEMLFGGDTTAQAATSAALKPVDCGGGTRVPPIFLPNIKYSADRFLGGDQSVIVALISIESNFHPKDISDYGAVGIAQFTGPTARGAQKPTGGGFFKGLTITDVPRADKIDKKVTPEEKQSFLTNIETRNDGRFYPNPSIDAAAYKIGAGIKKYGGLKEGYAQGYHRWGKNKDGTDKEDQKAASYKAAKKFVDLVEAIRIDGGGCKALKDTPGKLGEDLRKLTTGAP
ncbi:MAG: transglycosylase SLT domain-containing protein [Patescibacteria group bacterium]